MIYFTARIPVERDQPPDVTFELSVAECDGWFTTCANKNSKDRQAKDGVLPIAAKQAQNAIKKLLHKSNNPISMQWRKSFCVVTMRIKTTVTNYLSINF